MNIFNYENDQKGKWWKNYFFLGTICVIVCIYFITRNSNVSFGESLKYWATGIIKLLPLLLFFETKIGSLKTIMLYIICAIIGNIGMDILIYFLSLSEYGVAELILMPIELRSNVYCCLFGVFVIFFFLNFEKYMLNGKKSIANWIYLIIIVFLYLIVAGGDSDRLISPGYALFIYNPVPHLYMYLAGLTLGLLYYAAKFIKQKASKKHFN